MLDVANWILLSFVEVGYLKHDIIQSVKDAQRSTTVADTSKSTATTAKSSRAISHRK